MGTKGAGLGTGAATATDGLDSLLEGALPTQDMGRFHRSDGEGELVSIGESCGRWELDGKELVRSLIGAPEITEGSSFGVTAGSVGAGVSSGAGAGRVA